MFKLVVFVVIVAAVYAAEEPVRVVRQGVVPIVQPTIQPIVATLNPYLRGNYPHHAYVKGAEATARIVSQHNDAAPDGSAYAYSYETENGIAVQEQGQWRPISPEEGIQAVVGSYRTPLSDGRIQIVEYSADENGYRPVIKYQ
ncbi:hypothetical protein WA026_003499 [Henosepilachna vigintioctopunctata]|uniref:Uncharacterized protein n=1 Tax=Henosepilachna vigintioctopunctata TaxID=420089 RepID=A0AAW1TN67_9CUCU